MGIDSTNTTIPIEAVSTLALPYHTNNTPPPTPPPTPFQQFGAEIEEEAQTSSNGKGRKKRKKGKAGVMEGAYSGGVGRGCACINACVH